MGSQNDDIISTLATENGWLSDEKYPLYLFQGFWYPGSFIGGAIAAQAETLPFKPSPSDIIIASSPKCGTTWMKALAFAITTRSHFSQSDTNNPLYLKNPHDLIPMLEADYASTHGSCGGIKFVSTHLPYTGLPTFVRACDCKIIYVWRDPKDAFVSLWHMCQKMRPNKEETTPIPLQDAFELFCNGVSPSGPYWDHVLGYQKALVDHPQNLLFFKYEDMMDDPEAHVKRLAKFMDCPFSPQEEEDGVVSRIVEMCSFERLRNLEVNKVRLVPLKGALDFSKDVFFRKGKVGDWTNYLTPEMGDKIDQITMDKFKDLLPIQLN